MRRGFLELAVYLRAPRTRAFAGSVETSSCEVIPNKSRSCENAKQQPSAIVSRNVRMVRSHANPYFLKESNTMNGQLKLI